MCVVIYESLVVSSQRMWHLVFWALWCLACCSQNTVAKVQQPIVTSHSLHVPLSQKRQYSVDHSPMNLIWHYKHVCVSAYTWRHKLEATLGWITSTGNLIYQKDDGANTKHERCHRLYAQLITMGQGIICGLLELDLAFSECQPEIQIVRQALFKWVFKVDLR